MQLRGQIIATTGAPLSKHITSHVMWRTVARRLAEPLGEEGDKLVKRVLGHSDGSVSRRSTAVMPMCEKCGAN